MFVFASSPRGVRYGAGRVHDSYGDNAIAVEPYVVRCNEQVHGQDIIERHLGAIYDLAALSDKIQSPRCTNELCMVGNSLLRAVGAV